MWSDEEVEFQLLGNFDTILEDLQSLAEDIASDTTVTVGADLHEEHTYADGKSYHFRFRREKELVRGWCREENGEIKITLFIDHSGRLVDRLRYKVITTLLDDFNVVNSARY